MESNGSIYNYQMKRISIITLVSLLLLISCKENNTENNDNVSQVSLFFKKGDRVCFVGNRITHGGRFHHNIYLYQVTRFPAQLV